MGKIVVIGSSNTDMVVKAPKIPVPGETILGGEFFMNPGGKGANQAVAAARLGGDVVFVGKIGNDMFGKQALESLSKENINVKYVLTDPKKASGVALITVDEKGENSIVVAPGSNNALVSNDLKTIMDILDEASVVLMQLEIPMQTIEFMAKKAKEKGVHVVLNPAPAAELSDELIKHLDMITPNETEAEILTGVKVNDMASAYNAAEILYNKGVKNIVVTLGQMGAVFFNGSKKLHVPGNKVKAVDTTAAGDTFTGALVVAFSKGEPIEKAIEFANKAAAISVTRMGALASIPYIHEV